ncbi:MAG: response regulator [Acidobacteria bacterium]|nr:response regulator [Acidobacteriota bacterium]
MMRILLADDSPHAQRMGERILREEGFEVVSVTDGETAMLRLADVDPDVVIADIFLPKRSGYDLCRFIKTNPKHSHARVILTAGLLEPFDEEQARGVRFDAVLKKPFEATAMVDLVRPMATAAELSRKNRTAPVSPPPEPVPLPPPEPEPAPGPPAPEARERRGLGLRGLFERKPTMIRVVPDMDPEPPAPRPQLVVKQPVAPPVERPAAPLEATVPSASAVSPAPTGPDSAIERYARQFLSRNAKPEPAPAADPESVRAAVTVALDAAMPALVDEITKRVLAALETSRSS